MSSDVPEYMIIELDRPIPDTPLKGVAFEEYQIIFVNGKGKKRETGINLMLTVYGPNIGVPKYWTLARLSYEDLIGLKDYRLNELLNITTITKEDIRTWWETNKHKIVGEFVDERLEEKSRNLREDVAWAIGERGC